MILDTQKTELKILDDKITGFNIGMNIGEDAGQTIFHCHIHIIQGRQGEILPTLRGGVQGVILKGKSINCYNFLFKF